MVVNSPLIRPALISWGGGIGGALLDCHEKKKQAKVLSSGHSGILQDHTGEEVDTLCMMKGCPFDVVVQHLLSQQCSEKK